MKLFEQRDSKLTIGEEAARWLCDLQEGDVQQQTAFFAWLQSSPRHVEEFLFATTMWKKLHRFGKSNPERVDRLIAVAEAVERDALNVVAISDASFVPPSASTGVRVRRRTLSLALAAMVVLSAGAVLWLVLTGGPTYATGIGEQRIVRLEDGSRVNLNTRSRMTVEFSEHGRSVHLLEGEALFTVAKDPTRPFRVSVGRSIIQAVGTQFNVHRQGSGAKVLVLEGAVQITHEQKEADRSSNPKQAGATVSSHNRSGPKQNLGTRLSAGEQAQILPDGEISEPTAATNVAESIAWRERRLIFHADRLEDVVADVNRYSQRPIRIEDAAAGDLRLTAIFDADDPQSLVRFLEEMNGVAVEERRKEVVVRSR